MIFFKIQFKLLSIVTVFTYTTNKPRSTANSNMITGHYYKTYFDFKDIKIQKKMDISVLDILGLFLAPVFRVLG